ncbi:uncharacterized protein [Primulina eburnea]|uniref:uncharacterized protein n=1 Tax=Primulina eburnea TaxID=1245227 RepID=UPI003C6C02B0
MRIKVDVDIRKPLKRCKKIRKPDGNWFIVQLKYEKLGSFCFVCGCLGHTERFCEIMFSSNDKNMKREWGPWLRAPERRGATSATGSKWLRETPSSTTGENVSDDGADNQKQKDLKIFRNPIFSGKSGGISGAPNREMMVHDYALVMGTKQNSKEIPVYEGEDEKNIELAINEDRKRRRATRYTNNQYRNVDLDNTKGPQVDNTTLDTIPDDKEEDIDTINDIAPEHFLTAGPGLQACRQP